MKCRALLKETKNSFQDILRRELPGNVASLALKSFIAMSISRIAVGPSRQACLRVGAAIESQLIRIGAANPALALMAAEGTRIAMPVKARIADAKALLLDQLDFNGRDAA